MSDPYDDFLRKEAEEEKWLKTRPVCAWCGQPIQDEYAYEIDGEMVCGDCIEDCRTYIPDGDYYE